MERLAFEANRTAKSPGADAVHDLRVAIRRLQQGLVTFKELFPRKPAKRIRKQLKAVLAAAGKLRDCDIALEILTRTAQPGAAALERHVHGARRTAERSLRLVLKHLSLRKRISKWCRQLSMDTSQPGPGPQPLRALAEETLPRLAQRFFRTGDAAASHANGETLHAFRILAKKFRYTLELFLSIYGAGAEECLEQIRSIQAILGRTNDYRTVWQMAVAAGSSEKLQAALKRSEQRKIRQFRRAWTRQFSSPDTARWLRVLRSPVTIRKAPARSGSPSPLTAAAAV